jgi:hypothetical protein
MGSRYIVAIAVIAFVLVIASFLGQAATIYSAQAVAKGPTDAIGIAPFTDRVDFGDVPAGSSVGKQIFLENEGDNDSSIRVFVVGPIGDLVKIEPGDSFNIRSGENLRVNLRLTMPASAFSGSEFKGKVVILRLPW